MRHANRNLLFIVAWVGIVLGVFVLNPGALGDLARAAGPYALLAVLSLGVWALVFFATVGVILLVRRRASPQGRSR